MRFSAVPLLLLALSCGAAWADSPRFRRSTSYAEARDVMQRLGFRPYSMPGADLCDPDDPRCYPEIENCARGRTFACTYTWKRGKVIVEIETRYAIPMVAGAECVVNCGKLRDPFSMSMNAEPLE